MYIIQPFYDIVDVRIIALYGNSHNMNMRRPVGHCFFFGVRMVFCFII